MEFAVNRLLKAACLGLLCGVAGSAGVHAQAPVFSFEDGIAPWTSEDATISQSSFGATDGSSALLMDNVTPGYKNKVAVSGLFGPATAGMGDAYNAFNLAANVIAGGGTPKFELDFSWDFTGVTASNWIQLGLAINSQAGFKEYGTGSLIEGNADISAPNPWQLDSVATADGVTFTPLGPNSGRLAIPLGPSKKITFVPDSTYYDIWFRSNGGWEGTVDFAVDNIRFTGVPVFESHTLFSWETPDDPGTPGVNEQLEGWRPNPAVIPASQNLSITTTGATHGSSALQLDRTPLPEGFSWGSIYGLDAEANPADQGKIDDLVERINGASQIAIDITFQDQFPISPTYSSIWLAFTDETGTQYQAGSPNFDVVEAAQQTTQTLIWDISEFDEYIENPEPGQHVKNLGVEGLLVGTNTLLIQLGTGTDGGAIYQIDNFRLISEVPDTTPGDFNEDGNVDGRDFLVWQRNPSVGDLADWQNNYGAGSLAAVAAVPEPATIGLIAFASLVAIGRRRLG